tara:strand:+ start:228 stop:476 length:249 start_codon:yes stop_codon:yes gene_type:complete
LFPSAVGSVLVMIVELAEAAALVAVMLVLLKAALVLEQVGKDLTAEMLAQTLVAEAVELEQQEQMEQEVQLGVMVATVYHHQ